MDKGIVIAKLREHEPEIKAAGIAQLSLFGSVARGEAGNDVDLLAEFEDDRTPSLIQLVGIENRLSDLLGCKVDLCQKATLKARVRTNVEREAVLGF
jgi:predicted nucleotidyltransferase